MVSSVSLTKEIEWPPKRFIGIIGPKQYLNLRDNCLHKYEECHYCIFLIYNIYYKLINFNIFV